AQRHGHPEHGLVEGERRLRLDVLAARRTRRGLAATARRPCPAAAAEEPAEQVAEAPGAASRRPCGAGGTEEVAEVERLAAARPAGEATGEPTGPAAGAEQPP